MSDQSSQPQGFRLVESSAFLLGSVLIALVWALPFGFFLHFRNSFDFMESRIRVWEYLGLAGWLSVAGILVGLVFRLITLLRGRPPSLAFAFAVPFFGSLAYTAVIEGFLMRQPPQSVWDSLFTNLFTAYVCGGVFLIPLALPYVKILQGLNGYCSRWSSTASPRALRHAGFAVVTIAFLLFSEGINFFEARRQFEAQRAVRVYGVDIPDRSVLLSREITMYEHEDYARVERCVFRIVGDLPTPLVEGAGGLSNSDPKAYTLSRLKSYTGVDDETRAMVRQAKWPTETGSVVGTTVRVGSVTYLDLALTEDR